MKMWSLTTEIWSSAVWSVDVECGWLLCFNMRLLLPRSIIVVLVAVEIIFLVFTISVSVERGRRQLHVFSTTPSPADVSTVDYDNDTADEFLTNYSLYCEQFLIPHVLNIQHYSKEKPFCPCIPNDLGLCFVHNILILLSRVSTVMCDIDIAILSVCLSVCPSVRPWRSGIRWKRLNISSQFFYHTVAQSF